MATETGKGQILVDPTTQPMIAAFTGAPRLRELRGKRVGLIDDSKPNGKELLEAHFLRETVGATPGPTDDGADHVRFSITIRQHKSLHNLIEGYPKMPGRPADVAETTCTVRDARFPTGPLRPT